MASFSGTVLGLSLAAVVLGSSAHALAQPTRYELDDAAPLSADGWTFTASGATSAFSAGSLRLQSTIGYAEWMLRVATDPPGPAPTAGWLAEARPGRGWWVEARMRVSTTNCLAIGGPGLWIDDGKFFIQLHLATTTLHFQTVQSHPIAISGSEFHVYRLTSLGGRHFQLLIDGVVAYDEPLLEAQENGKALMFGDLGGCDAADTTWDYLAYDTFGPKAAPGDTDSDGVADALDDCPLLANADQADADHDGVGDACDICPQDPKDDQDNDGLCAGQDTCPDDARNDMDKDGVCDTLECAPYQVQSSVPAGACPAICNCRIFPIGNDPAGGFGNLDNFGGTYPVSTGGTGVGTGGTGASAGGARGGNTAAGGASNSSGSGSSNSQATNPASASDNAGCACRMARPTAPAEAWLASGMLFAALGAAASRASRGRRTRRQATRE